MSAPIAGPVEAQRERAQTEARVQARRLGEKADAYREAIAVLAGERWDWPYGDDVRKEILAKLHQARRAADDAQADALERVQSIGATRAAAHRQVWANP